MGTITQKLDKLLATKAAIKAAIIAKGVSVSDTDPFSAYAGKIGSISTGVALTNVTLTLTGKAKTGPTINVSHLVEEGGSITYKREYANVNNVSDAVYTYIVLKNSLITLVYYSGTKITFTGLTQVDYWTPGGSNMYTWVGYITGNAPKITIAPN